MAGLTGVASEAHLPFMRQHASDDSAHPPSKKPGPAGSIVTYALLGLWTLVCLFPLYWVAITSLKDEQEIAGGPFYLPFVDFTPVLDAWAFVLADPAENLLTRYLNSAIVGLLSTMLTLFIGGLAVYGLTRFRYALPWRSLTLCFLGILTASALFIFPSWVLFGSAVAILLLFLLATRSYRRGPDLNNRGIMIAIVATRILPPVVIVLPIYMMAQFTGTLDSLFALIFTYTAANLPVAVWLLLPLFGPVATEQEEAARLDGASNFSIFSTIFIPMVAAGIGAVGLLIFILCWGEYLFAAYLAGDQAMTLPPWVVGQLSLKEAQIGGEAQEWANLSAATILMVLPLLACTALAQRFLSRLALWRR